MAQKITVVITVPPDPFGDEQPKIELSEEYNNLSLADCWTLLHTLETFAKDQKQILINKIDVS